MLELSEDLFDWIQVGRYFGRNAGFIAGRGAPGNRIDLVAADFDHDDDVVRSRRGNDDVLDIVLNLSPSITHGSWIRLRCSAARAVRSVSADVRELCRERCALRRPAAQGRYIGFGQGLVDEDPGAQARCG
jgi:hypothetical protein